MFRASLLFFFTTVSVAFAEGGEHAAGNPNEIYWKWANFVLLVVGIGYMIGKHAPAFFKGQDEIIQRDLREAAEMKRSAEAKTAEIEKRLATLSTEIETIRASASKELETEHARVNRETEVSMAKLEAHAAQEIESATKTAMAELKSYSAKLALEQAEVKIRGQVTPVSEALLIDGFLKRLN